MEACQSTIIHNTASTLFRLRYQKAWQGVGDRVGYGFSLAALPALLYEDHSSHDESCGVASAGFSEDV
jgi:hypothetical protein